MTKRDAGIPPAPPDAPILLFDSGVGGLSVLAALRDLLPDAPVLYVADNAGLPYGARARRRSPRGWRGCWGG